MFVGVFQLLKPAGTKSPLLEYIAALRAMDGACRTGSATGGGALPRAAPTLHNRHDSPVPPRRFATRASRPARATPSTEQTMNPIQQTISRRRAMLGGAAALATGALVARFRDRSIPDLRQPSRPLLRSRKMATLP